MVLSYPRRVLRCHGCKPQSLDQGLLGQSLLGKHVGGTWRSLLALRRIEQRELFDLVQFLEQLLDRQIPDLLFHATIAEFYRKTANMKNIKAGCFRALGASGSARWKSKSGQHPETYFQKHNFRNIIS